MADLLQIGEVLGVHGVKGALRVRLHSASSTALEKGREVQLLREGKLLLQSKIDRASVKPGTDQVRLWLEALSTRDAAEELRGAGLWMDRAELDELEDDEFYLADLVGLELRMRSHPELSLGQISAVIDNRMQDLLEVEWQGDSGKPTRWLLPAVGPYLEEIEEEILWIDPPEGLLPSVLERRLQGEA